MTNNETKELIIIGALKEIPKNEWTWADEMVYEISGEWPTRYTEKAKSLISPLPHGWPIKFLQKPYHDVTIYEDGYEEWVNIGD